MSYEVVIIGGGPAGMATAIVLARNGVETLLCEGRRLPADKPCGEGLMPNALRHLDRLGIRRIDLDAVGQPIDGVRYIGRRGRIAEARFAEGPGLGIRRARLSEALLAQAENQRYLTLLPETPARLAFQGDRPCVAVRDAIIEPRLVIAADGVNSLIRKEAKIWTRIVPALRYGRRRHYRVASARNLVEVHWADASEAYVTPTAADQVNVAFLWDREACREEFEPCRDPNFLARFPDLAEQLRAAEPCDEPRAIGPMQHEVPIPARDGLLLVGDAAGYVDAITGEGLGLAFEQALLVERWLLPWLKRPTYGDPIVSMRALEPYLRAARRAAAANRRVTRWLLRVRRHPALLERVIGRLGADPDLFQHFLSVNQGLASPFQPPLASLKRLFVRSPAYSH